jgi:hypothetical protein
MLQDDDYQYVYDTSAFVKTKVSGQRLIGASKGQHSRIPFIVAWDPIAKDDKAATAQCSGLVLPDYLNLFFFFLTDTKITCLQ